jgi:hypothetical protein
MAEAREIAERYHLGGVISSTRSVRSLRALDRSTGEAVVFELAPWTPGMAGGDAPSESRRAGFLAAAANLAELRHPSLPAVLDYGQTAEGDLFLVREADVGRGLETLAGEPPARVLELLLQAVDALDLLARHGLHHGALSADSLRVVSAPGGPRCRIVGLAHGLAAAADSAAGAAAADAEQGRRGDVRSLAVATCRLLGAAVRDPGSPAPRVKIPLGVSFELEDAEALRRVLERCLRQDAEERPASYDEIRDAFFLAIWGVPRERMPATAPAPPYPAGSSPPVRLTFSTEPPDVGLVVGGDEIGAGARLPAGAPAPAAAEDEITKVVLEAELAGDDGRTIPGPDDAGPGETPTPPAAPAAATAGPGPDDTSPGVDAAVTGLEDTSPGVDATVTGLEDTSPDVDRTLSRLAAAGPSEDAALPEEAPPEWVAALPAAPPAAAAAPAGAPPRRRRRRRAVAAGALAAVVVGALIVVFAVVLPRTGEPPPPPAPARPAPPPVAAPPAEVAPSPAARHRGLLEAKVQLVNGDDGAAAAALAAIPTADEASFSAADCELAAWLAASLLASGEERLAVDLARGLAGGDLALLRRAVAAAGGMGRSFLDRYPEVEEGLKPARRALALDAGARRAFDAGDHPQAIEAAGQLLAVLPGSAGAVELRERAAAAIEGEAAAAIAAGRFEDALARLAALERAWPDRPGLAERFEGARSRLRARRDLDEVLAAARQAGERGEPDAGLALLAGVAAGEGAAPRVAEVRRRLEERLADLDRRPPAIELAAESAGEIAKGESAAIVCRVTDDYRVARVAVFVRPEGGAFRELPVRRAGDEAVAEVPAELHGGRAVDFYITAADLSGHQASLGSADQPLPLKRRRWFRRVFGD